MVMGGGAQLTLVIEARDLASQRLKETGNQVGFLEGQVRKAQMSFFRLTGILSAVGISTYALINAIKTQFEDMERTNRVATTLTSQFRFMGFSAEDAAGSVRNLRNNLNSAAFQALPGMDEAMKSFLANMDPDTVTRMNQLEEALVTLFGVDKQTAIKAIAEAMAGNVEALSKLTGSTASAEEQFNLLKKALDERNKSLTESQSLWEDFGDAAPKALGNFMATVGKMLDQAVAFPSTFPQKVMEMLGNLGIAMSATDTSALPVVGLGWGQTIGASMVGGIMTGLQQLGTLFPNIWDTLSSIPGAALEWGTNIGMGIVAGIVQGWNVLSQWFTTGVQDFFIDKLPGFISFVLENFKLVGMGIVTGIWQGIQSLATWLWNLVKGWAESILNAVKTGLGALNPFGAPTTTATPSTVQPASQSMTPAAFGGRTSVIGGSQIIPITLQVGQNTFGKAVLEVVDGHVRLLEPGLGLR